MTGKQIKIARIEAGKKQIEVSFATGIPAPRLSVIENGWAEARPQELAAIRRALGLDDSGMVEGSCNVVRAF